MIKAVIFDMYETLITHYRSPLYFGPQMAADAGITESEFLKLWRSTEHERSTGKLTFEDTIKMILEKNHMDSPDILEKIVRKRTEAKEECFRNLHPQIIPMLEELRKQGIKIGLISNCYSEEAEVIRHSILFPYFDTVLLSYEEGIQKPDHEIFARCMERLSVTPEECLYIGDGGSFELETAREMGMTAMQAVWYFQEGITLYSVRKNEFPQLEEPMEIRSVLTTQALNLSAVHHVAIIVSDYRVSRDFYVNKLGFSVIRENFRPERKDWKLDLKCGDIELEIFGIENPPKRVTNPEACGLRHLAFHVDSVEETVKILEARGISCEPIRTDTFTNKKMTFFRDPDDLPLELHE